MSYRSYYITPTRLTKNPYLWRSIGLMTTLKPDQRIVLPEATLRWLRSGMPVPNWQVISVENAVLCLNKNDYNFEFRWQDNIPHSEKILDLLLKDTSSDKIKIPLSTQYVREESLTLFIENQLTDLAKKVEAYVPPSPWSSFPERTRLHNWVTYITGNASLKTYQLEMLFRLLPKDMEPTRTFLGRVKMDLIPDYMFKVMLDEALAGKTNMSEHLLYPLAKEALRRKMLVKIEPAMVTVQPQPRPTTFEKPVVAPVVPTVVQA